MSISLVLNAFADTLTSAVLNRLGFIVNAVHLTLICTHCSVSVNHAHILTHFKTKSHNIPRPKGDVQAQLNEDLARIRIEHNLPSHLVFPPVTPQHVVDAVFGLAQPIRDAIRCSRCNRWYKGLSEKGVATAFTMHRCPEPNADVGSTSVEPPRPARFAAETANVQQFFSKSGAERFKVHITEPPAPPLSLFAQYQLQSAPPAGQPGPDAVTENHRVYHQFLRKERWIDHLKPFGSLVLVDLHQITLKDLHFPRLARHVERYLLDMQDNLQNYLVRRLIGKRPATESVILNTLSTTCSYFSDMK